MQIASHSTNSSTYFFLRKTVNVYSNTNLCINKKVKMRLFLRIVEYVGRCFPMFTVCSATWSATRRTRCSGGSSAPTVERLLNSSIIWRWVYGPKSLWPYLFDSDNLCPSNENLSRALNLHLRAVWFSQLYVRSVLGLWALNLPKSLENFVLFDFW